MNPASVPAPLQKSHPLQSDLNLALLNFVNQRGEATWDELFAAFGDGAASEKGSTARFCNKLNYLTTTQRLQSTGRFRNRVFSIGPMADKPATLRGRITAKAGQADGSDIPRPYPSLPYLGAVVGARVYISTDPYVPPPNQVLRPGALDFQRYGTHGQRC